MLTIFTTDGIFATVLALVDRCIEVHGLTADFAVVYDRHDLCIGNWQAEE